jgi:hypothetical protein
VIACDFSWCIAVSDPAVHAIKCMRQYYSPMRIKNMKLRRAGTVWLVTLMYKIPVSWLNTFKYSFFSLCMQESAFSNNKTDLKNIAVKIWSRFLVEIRRNFGCEWMTSTAELCWVPFRKIYISGVSRKLYLTNSVAIFVTVKTGGCHDSIDTNYTSWRSKEVVRTLPPFSFWDWQRVLRGRVDAVS